jgi:hypothetical protein
MNLVQISERLKDLPASLVKQYADGKNPAEVPPYLAAAELARKVRMEQQGAQAPQKTVKEQLEEKLGLGALQPAIQGQGAPQGMPQGQPPGAPQGMPPGMPQGMAQGMPQQGEQQQEAPPPAMAASGGYLQGIAKIPVNMFKQSSYAGGGIVAFDDGGDVESEIERLKARYASSQEDKREALRSEGRAQAATADRYSPEVLTSGPRARAYDEALKEYTTERSPEEMMRERADLARKQMEIDKQLRKDAGVEDIGLGALKRAEEREKMYEEEKGRRSNENLIARLSKLSMPNMYGRVMGGDYGTMYAQQASENRASDMAFRDAQDKLKDAIDDKRRADAVGNLSASKEASQAILQANRELAKLRVTGAGEMAKIEGQGIPNLIQAKETERANLAKEAEDVRKNNIYERLQKEQISIQRAQLLATEASRKPEVIRMAEELGKRPEYSGKPFSELLELALRASPTYSSGLERLEQLRADNIRKAIDDQKTIILQANLRIQNAKTEDDRVKAKNDLKEIYDNIYARYPAVGGIGGLGQKPAGAPTTGAPAAGNTRMKFDAKGNPIP